MQSHLFYQSSKTESDIFSLFYIRIITGRVTERANIQQDRFIINLLDQPIKQKKKPNTIIEHLQCEILFKNGDSPANILRIENKEYCLHSFNHVS